MWQDSLHGLPSSTIVVHRLQRNTRRWWVLRALAAAAPALVLLLSASCDDEPTSPQGGPPSTIRPPRLSEGSGGDNPDSLPPGSFAITLHVDDVATGVFQKRQFASYTGKTLVKFTASENIQKVHRVSGSTTWITPRGHSVGGGCYSYVVVDFRKTGNLYGGGWAGMCNAQLITTLVLEGTGTATRTPGYPWSGTQQCGGTGQPICFEYYGWHKVQLTPTSQKLEVVVDSSSVMSGSTVRFTARRTDGGAFTVQSWTWKPITRVSNAGTTTASTYGPSATGCSVNPICNVMLTNTETSSGASSSPQRGIMYVRALVNGIVETARAEVIVSRGQLRLQAAPEEPWVGDSVRFTPSTTDGQAIRVLSWQWMPDTAPGRTVGCAPSETTNDCVTPVFERGVMYVTAEVGQIVLANAIRSSARRTSDVSLSSGGITTQRAAVRVVPKPDTLTLTATPQTIDPGDFVSFTPSAKSGRPIEVISWAWANDKPDDPEPHTVPCEPQEPTCQTPVYHSGTMVVRARIAGVEYVASVHVAVRPWCPPTGDPILDDPTVRNGLKNALIASGIHLPQLQRQEKVGVVRRRPDGTLIFETLIPQGYATHCAFRLKNPAALVDWPTDSDIVAYWHTHPSTPGDSIYGCGAPDDPPIPYRPHLQGGGSEGDWIQLNRANDARVAAGAAAVPEYVIDTQNVYTMPANVHWKNAVSGYKYTTHTPAGCRWN